MRIKMTVLLGVLLLLAGVAVTSPVRAADDPSNGTWKLNVAKSNFGSAPALKSETVTVSIENDTETYKSESETADGKTMSSSFEAKIGGEAAPISGVPYADMIAIKRMSSHHLMAHLSKGGKPTVTVNVVVAANGKTRTLTSTGTDENGKAMKSTLVFDKQM